MSFLEMFLLFTNAIFLIVILALHLSKTPLNKIQHLKRGSIYEVIGMGKIQTDVPLVDYDEVFVYKDIENEDIWIRPVSEFQDGRFKYLT